MTARLNKELQEFKEKLSKLKYFDHMECDIKTLYQIRVFIKSPKFDDALRTPFYNVEMELYKKLGNGEEVDCRIINLNEVE
jgi:hypothetical protein